MWKHEVKPITNVAVKVRIRYHDLYAPSLLRSFSDRLRAGATYAELAEEIGCEPARVARRIREYREKHEAATAITRTARSILRARIEARAPQERTFLDHHQNGGAR